MRIFIFTFLFLSFYSLSFADFNSSFSPDSSVLNGVKTMYVSRFDTFILTVRSSPLFSLPDQIKNLSVSGSSVLTFSAGCFAPADSGGQITYDFSGMIGNFPFLFLRSLCLSLATFYALNHVLRGGAG